MLVMPASSLKSCQRNVIVTERIERCQGVQRHLPRSDFVATGPPTSTPPPGARAIGMPPSSA
jgi:hypothetical protein